MNLFNKLPIIDKEQDADIVSATLREMDINSFSNLFSYYVRLELQNCGLNKIGPIMDLHEKNLLWVHFSPDVASELNSIINLLKCEYFDSAPEIDEFDTEMSIATLLELLGVPIKPGRAIARSKRYINADDFFADMRASDAREILLEIDGIGPQSAEEILERVSIIMRYYDRMAMRKSKGIS